MARRIRDEQAPARVIEAAWRVVASHGVEGATMRTIAAEAGVTTGFVTHYFADKRELLREVLRHNNLRARDRVLAAVGERRGLVALENAVEALLPIDDDRARTWQVWIAAWRPTAAAEHLTDELRGGRQYVERMFAEMLEQAVGDGQLPATLDVPFEAQRLVTLIAGTGLVAGVESPARMRRVAKRMLAEQLASLEGPRQERQGLER